MQWRVSASNRRPRAYTTPESRLATLAALAVAARKTHNLHFPAHLYRRPLAPGRRDGHDDNGAGCKLNFPTGRAGRSGAAHQGRRRTYTPWHAHCGERPGADVRMEAELSAEVSGKVNSIPMGKLIVEALTLNSRSAAQSPRSSLCSL